MPQDLDAAAKALDDFASGPVVSAARSIETVIDRTFAAMERSIVRAVTTGKVSMADFAASAIASVDRLAAREFIAAPLESALSAVVSAVVPVGGARAEGGPVDSSHAYLVGENGPEMFVPNTSGTILPNTRPSIVLNVSARDAPSFLKSETQLAAMLSRALARGQRNM